MGRYFCPKLPTRIDIIKGSVVHIPPPPHLHPLLFTELYLAVLGYQGMNGRSNTADPGKLFRIPDLDFCHLGSRIQGQ